ncbi:sensor histidine kinase [Rhizobium sp. G187]|uniref:sensor histidine kinase n=1 Tax=Rhizobium sp. G187 TaxID=3451352 RepID=UPI003EE4F74D
MQRTEPSLFSRLVIRVTMVLAGGAAILMTAAWIYAKAAADEAYDRLLQGAAIQILDSLSVVDGKIEVNLPPSAFELLGLAPRDKIFYRVVLPDGETLTGYEDLAEEADLNTPRATPLFQTITYRDQEVRLVITSRAMADQSVGGWAHVAIAQTVEARHALTTELTTRAFLLVALMSLLALGGTIIAVRYSLRPLDALGDTLRRRDPQDLTPLDVSVPRELAPFVGSINHFMRRLDERLRLLQRFIADSAHQIRTPLTALSAQVSLIDEEAMAENDRRHLSRVKSRTAELARFTTQLLNHAMVIHRFDSVQLSPLDLTDVARKAFRAAVPITIDPDTVVSFEAPDERLTILGDGLSLREAIVNIIDNSLRHGTLQKLEVRVLRRGNYAQVEVEDDGPGIAPADWQTVTKRFVSSKSGEGSSGLGFAIAAEVAAALGGSLSFREKTDVTDFAVVLELPLMREEIV